MPDAVLWSEAFCSRRQPDADALPVNRQLSLLRGRSVEILHLIVEPGIVLMLVAGLEVFAQTKSKLQLTQEGSSRMSEATSGHVGDRIAVMVDSRLVAAPLILQRVETTEFTLVLLLPKDVAQEVAATLATRWPRR